MPTKSCVEPLQTKRKTTTAPQLIGTLLLARARTAQPRDKAEALEVKHVQIGRRAQSEKSHCNGGGRWQVLVIYRRVKELE